MYVKPDRAFREFEGIEFSDEFNPEKHVAVTGTILAPPDRLLFFGEAVERLMKTGSRSDIEKAQQLVKHSMSVKVPMEVKTGDRVMYPYIYGHEVEEDMKYKDGYFMPYDCLYCRLGKDDLYMLNDYLFVRPIVQDQIMIEGIEAAGVEDKRIHGVGVVQHIGTPARGYLMGSMEHGFASYVGQKVYFSKSSAVRVEFGLHQMHNKDSDYSLWRLQRKDIFAYS